MSKVGRGRPKGYVVSQATKDKTSKTKMGSRHTIETRDKISEGVSRYFRSVNPVSKELINRYHKVDKDGSLEKWIRNNAEALDDGNGMMSDKILATRNRHMERQFGNNIEYMGHDETPESIVIAVEAVIIRNRG